ncbi:DUF302 domain-containing protein [Thetidibacter halocola]|uniref:DUF302 domain-containing protein n=1 Tax=Thetidibacter halocola TaxID=2827239 RepID=A0A8J7WDT1_9RHOB|nr:DUF302 domain-containing protein [Thetidibacter halocola]MBS0123354.1 DUF302 domain-containing protein [Thetidibacter halocola]
MKNLIAVLAMLAAPALAQDAVTYETDQSFDDVVFGLESAILDRGLVIDSVSHTGEMLERTRVDVGSDVVLFEQADVFSFCSAALSRKVMEVDPMNIVFCPYDIFVMVQPSRPDVTVIGFRSLPEGPMKEIEALLDGIAKAAIGLD